MVNLLSPPIHEKDHNSASWVAWFRSIGVTNVVMVTGGNNLNLTQPGSAVLLSADVADAAVTLPYGKALGSTVTVVLTDATNNGMVYPKTGETIVGNSSVTMNEDYMSLTFMVSQTGKWVII